LTGGQTVHPAHSWVVGKNSGEGGQKWRMESTKSAAYTKYVGRKKIGGRNGEKLSQGQRMGGNEKTESEPREPYEAT